jgi:hypothetical protein
MKIDPNDIQHVKRLGFSPVKALACPIDTRSGKINPHITSFLTDDNQIVHVVHVKPIYYETRNGQWRPIGEILSYHGNQTTTLNGNWWKAHPRFIDWLVKRQRLFGRELVFPTPLGNIGAEFASLLNPSFSIGLTTLTAYPDPNPETTTVDGVVSRTVVGEAWATIRSGAGNGASDSVADEDTARLAINGAGTLWETISRSIYLFDTSSIADSDTIDSATFSFVLTTNKTDGLGGGHTFSIVASTPASNTVLATSDYGNLGTTRYATDVTIAGATANSSTYTDFALNATGLAAVNKVGITKIGERIGADTDNTEPGSHPGSERARCFAYYADQAGTSTDPKLVVVSSAAAAAIRQTLTMMGVGS